MKYVEMKDGMSVFLRTLEFDYTCNKMVIKTRGQGYYSLADQ